MSNTRILAVSVGILLISTAVAALLGNIAAYILFLSPSVILALGALLAFEKDSRRRAAVHAQSLRNDIGKLTETVSELSSQIELRERQVSKELSAKLDAQQKSIGLVFRGIKDISSILSGVNPVLVQQNEQRLATCLLALRSTKRELESAIERAAGRAHIGDENE